MNDESQVSCDIATWQDLTGFWISSLAKAARRHHVMVNISISPYESAEDDRKTLPRGEE